MNDLFLIPLYYEKSYLKTKKQTIWLIRLAHILSFFLHIKGFFFSKDLLLFSKKINWRKQSLFLRKIVFLFIFPPRKQQQSLWGKKHLIYSKNLYKKNISIEDKQFKLKIKRSKIFLSFDVNLFFYGMNPCLLWSYWENLGRSKKNLNKTENFFYPTPKRSKIGSTLNNFLIAQKMIFEWNCAHCFLPTTKKL